MFDAVKFLEDNFLSPNVVYAILTNYKLPAPPTDTIRKWFARGSIPAEWLPVLICCLELENGAPIFLAKYIHLEG